MSSIAAISSASSSSASISIEVDTSNSTTGKNASFSQKSRNAFYSLAKSVSARTVGLFTLRAPEFSPHFLRSAPNSPRPSSRFKRGPIPPFSTRGQTPLPKIVITPADDGEERSELEVELLTDSFQEFPDLFWPYKDSLEQTLPKKIKRDRPFFGFKRASKAHIPQGHSTASDTPEMPESIPTPYNYQLNRRDSAIDENKENKQLSTSSMDATGVGRSSFDSMSTAEINFMLGKIWRAPKSGYSTEYTGDYADSEMERSEYEHNPLAKISPATVRLPTVMTAQCSPTIKTVS